MLLNNLDIVVEQAKQRRQELLMAAEHHHLLQATNGNQPGIFGQTLTYVGDLLVTGGEWLKRQGELPQSNQTIVSH